ncbi:MAG: hypothetical protein JO298_04950 [Verrucomicrobia bacterium]|nr:hypothetical protein [Verrucomicrobiota bacterium]
MKTKHPATAFILQSMYEEEAAHRARLMDFYQQRHGDHLPFLRRQDVHGFVKRRPIWLIKTCNRGMCSAKPWPWKQRRAVFIRTLATS